VVQRSNTALGQVSDNTRWTQHRSFAVSGKRVIVISSIPARRSPRMVAMAAPGQAPQPLTAIDAALRLAAARKANGQVGVARFGKEVSSSSHVSPPWPVQQPVMKA
jgi:hypothetical protein